MPGYAGDTAIRHRSRRALIALGAAPRLDQRALAVALEPVLQAFGRSGGRALCLVWTAAPGGRPRSAPTCGAAGSS